MLNFRLLLRVDLRVIFLILLLNVASLFTISSFSPDFMISGEEKPFFHSAVLIQIHWLLLGWLIFFLVTAFDYRKWRELTWIFYGLSLLGLIGLFFTDPIVRVQRWYKIPGLGISIQPSEYAKLSMLFAMAWFMEKHSQNTRSFAIFSLAFLIVAIPFFLILKQPDLGTAFVFYPMVLVMFYFGGVAKKPLMFLLVPLVVALVLVGVIFSGVVSYDALRPYVRGVLKEYQYERLNPETHHGKAAQMAIALGGVSGAGWRQGEFWRGGGLPAPYTDSIFSAYGEEFGLIGMVGVLLIYYLLIYTCFQAAASAKDIFGRLIAAGFATSLAVHVIVNIGMMSGCLPITGVPLPLLSYGGSSYIATMAGLGIVQSIYTRRFMFSSESRGSNSVW